MTEIIDIIASPALTGFYFDDQKAIKCGAKTDGLNYKGDTATPGFESVRQAGEAFQLNLFFQMAAREAETVQLFSILAQVAEIPCF